MPLHSVISGAASCALTSLAWGLITVRRLKLQLNRLESLCIGYVLGSAIVSAFALLLSFLMLARKGVFVAFTALSLPVLFASLRWVRRCDPFIPKSVPGAMRALFVAGFLVYAALYIRQALTPDTSADAMTYHLGFVNLWNEAHGMRRFPDMYAAMPAGLEMLYLFAFSIGRHAAADLVHLTFLLSLPLLMVLYAERFGLRHGSGVAAALILFATPLVGWDGSVAYNDVALAAVTFTSFYLVQQWRRDRNPGSLIAAGVAAGFSLAIKYTAVFGALFIAALGLRDLAPRFRKEWRVAIAAASVVACLAVPYLIRNAVWFHDPIFPFGNAIFPNPYFHLSNEREYIAGQTHLNGVTWRDLPRESTIGGTKLPDSLGPMYVLAPLALVALAWPESRDLAFGFLALAAACLTNRGARFLIPALPFCLLALTYSLSRASRAAAPILGLVAIAQLVVSWPIVIDKLGTPRGSRPGLTPWSVVFRKTPAELYLSDVSPDYLMARAIDNYVPDGMPVFALADGFAQAYTSHFVLNSYHSAQAESMSDLLYSNADSPNFTRRVWRSNFPETRIKQLEILQTGRGADKWNVSEVSLSLGGRRVWPRDPRASAEPNPWDAPFVVDGSSATRWMSWDPMRPGMNIRIRYPDRPLADEIDIDCGEGQWDSRMQVRAEVDGGRWIAPDFASWITIPASDQRRAAAAGLKKRGIRYVVISKGAWRSTQFTTSARAWGLKEVFSGRDATLYRIE